MWVEMDRQCLGSGSSIEAAWKLLHWVPPAVCVLLKIPASSLLCLKKFTVLEITIDINQMPFWKMCCLENSWIIGKNLCCFYFLFWRQSLFVIFPKVFPYLLKYKILSSIFSNYGLYKNGIWWLIFTVQNCIEQI